VDARRTGIQKARQQTRKYLTKKLPGVQKEKMKPKRGKIRSDLAPIENHHMGIVIFLSFVIAITFALGCGAYVNNGKKYVRIQGNQENCASSWINIHSPDSPPICCPKNKKLNADGEFHMLESSIANLCEHSASTYSKMVVTLWGAWMLPLFPFILNTGIQAQRHEEQTLRRSIHARRLMLYVVSLLGRTFILYWASDSLEKMIQGPETSDCWYSSLRWGSKCKENFDTSDHIVLFMCQYLAVQIVEMYAIFQENQQSFSRWILSLVSAVVSLISLHGIYGTTAYFHDIAESFTGYILSLVTVYLPLLYVVTNTNKQSSRHVWLNARYYIHINHEHDF